MFQSPGVAPLRSPGTPSALTLVGPRDMEGLHHVAEMGGGDGCGIAFTVAKERQDEGSEEDMHTGSR